MVQSVKGMRPSELYLVRHALAAERGDDWPDDTKRPLTAEGTSRFREVVSGLVWLGVGVDEIFTSPLVRARQTAEAIARAVRVEAQVEEALAPGATAAGLAEALAGLRGPIATVGHQPDCSEIAYDVLGRDPGFPVAGMAEMELHT